MISRRQVTRGGGSVVIATFSDVFAKNNYFERPYGARRTWEDDLISAFNNSFWLKYIVSVIMHFNTFNMRFSTLYVIPSDVFSMWLYPVMQISAEINENCD